MDWANDWLLGLPLLVVTVVFHVAAFLGMTKILIPEMARARRRVFGFNVSVGLLALFAAILHALEAVVWAALYVHVGALPNFADAILYSLEAITSYGHAPERLAAHWQLLGAIEAINGMILFGLTTAFFFAAIQNAWPGRSRSQ